MNPILSEEQLDEIVHHENEHWSKIFEHEKKTLQKSLYSSYWWEDYFTQIRSIASSHVRQGSSVLEIGAGSGKASLLLGDSYKKHLFDISPPALDFAKLLAKRLESKNVTFELGNGFDTKLPSKSYDFVWNIGVIEHYSREQATVFVGEMIRHAKNGGVVAVAVPNFKSFQTWKASMLNKPLFRFIPGYRLDSENDYKKQDLHEFITVACKQQKRRFSSIQDYRVGNPLPMGSPKLVIRTIGRPIHKLFKKNRFLLLTVVNLE